MALALPLSVELVVPSELRLVDYEYPSRVITTKIQHVYRQERDS